MIAKRTAMLGAVFVLAALLLAACGPGTPAATQEPAAEVTQAVTADLPETGATTEAPSATEAVTTAPAATEAATESPAATEASTQAPAGTTGSAAGVTCTLSSDAEQQLVSTGQNIYSSTCTACHGAQGEGQGSFPVLAGNTDIQAQDPTQMIQILINPQVHPFADQLSNQEVAAVLSYTRSDFGNQAPAICEEQVEAVRPGQ